MLAGPMRGSEKWAAAGMLLPRWEPEAAGSEGRDTGKRAIVVVENNGSGFFQRRGGAVGGKPAAAPNLLSRARPRRASASPMIRFILLVNKQGQTRLASYYGWQSVSERVALEAEVIRRCLSRAELQCSFMTFREYKVVYRRYASLYFIVGALCARGGAGGQQQEADGARLLASRD
jgi:hypothetical protein